MGSLKLHSVDIVLFVTGVAFAAGVSCLQTRLGFGRGSDHPVHIFLINAIRANGRKLFRRVPNLVNDSYCGAYPLFLHWVLSFLPSRWLRHVTYFLNPAINVSLVLLTYSIASVALTAPLPGLAALIAALTPQFHHVLSARIYGISSRPIGLLLFNLWLAACAIAQYSRDPRPAFVAAVILSYLIWGFNTFAQQAMLLFGAVFGAIFGTWTLLLSAGISVLLFLAVTPGYAAGYLRHTLLFCRNYATDISKIYLFPSRPSIWRDLVLDLWVRKGRSLKERMLYIYGSPVVIVVLFNPLTLMGVLPLATGEGNRILEFASRVSLAALLVFIATSFRVTRFLGEPERYVELVTNYSAIAGVGWLASSGHLDVSIALAVWFAVLDSAQLYALYFKSVEAPEPPGLARVRKVMTDQFGPAETRFISNNEDMTKHLMTQPWNFARYWSAEEKFAGYSFREAFSVYPCYRKPAFEDAIRQYRLNAVLLDKTVFADCFEANRDRLAVLLDDERFRLYRVTW